MAVKAPPPAPAPIPTWAGFYGGIQFGGGWGNEAVNYSANDPASAQIINGTPGFAGEQPLPNGYRISQTGPVGGFEAGYNWQLSSNLLLGVEADFSFSDMSGKATATSLLSAPLVNTITAEQRTDWFGTIRGRAGWLAMPNLLLFGTGGFAYGRVADSATYATAPPGMPTFLGSMGGFSFECPAGVPCFVGSSSAIRTGWSAGGGAEWLLDRHWSAKVEYQFVNLGTETVRVTALLLGPPSTTLSSFNAAFHDQFNVLRVGLNYRF